jgi:hypothetical protein
MASLEPPADGGVGGASLAGKAFGMRDEGLDVAAVGLDGTV